LSKPTLNVRNIVNEFQMDGSVLKTGTAKIDPSPINSNWAPKRKGSVTGDTSQFAGHNISVKYGFQMSRFASRSTFRKSKPVASA